MTGSQGRYCLGQHLPCDFTGSRVWRHENLRLRSRKRFSGSARLHPTQDRVDEYIAWFVNQSIS